jgi:hypothetical protein
VPFLLLSHSGNFPTLTDELPVQVPDVTLDLLFVLRKKAVISAGVNSWVKLFTTSLPTSFKAGLLKRRAEKLTNHPHTHSIFRRLDLLNKSATDCLNKSIA